MSLTVRCQKISLVPTHQLIVPSTLLAPTTNIRTHKATKIHTLEPLTYELFFQNSSKGVWGLVEITNGLVHASYSLPKWQAVKLTSFAPCLTPFKRKNDQAKKQTNKQAKSKHHHKPKPNNNTYSTL